MAVTKCCYTVITGNYDKLRIPVVTPGWDYICFSDTDQESKVWKAIRINGEDKKRLSRLPKIKWFEFLDYDITLYVDAVFGIVGNLNNFLDIAYKPGHHCAFPHYARACVYKEANILKKLPGVREYVQHLKEIGYPEKKGLYMNGFMIRDKDVPHDPYKKWWEDFVKYSRRDQLSFMPNAHDLKLHPIKNKILKTYFKKFHHEYFYRHRST